MSSDNKQELSQLSDTAIAPQKKETIENQSISALIEMVVEESLKLDKTLNDEDRAKKIVEKRDVMEGFIKSFETPDVLKTMLATQILDNYEHQQRIIKHIRLSTYPPHQQSFMNTAAKLSNVFIQQVGLMQKLCGQGQQRVTVEHVHVHSGGQAIVGNVEKKT